MSQGQQTSQEILLIRAALKQQGHRVQKQPKQAVWVISFTDGRFYRLTYQPAPVNAWSLYPPDRNASSLLSFIQKTLDDQSTETNRRDA